MPLKGRVPKVVAATGAKVASRLAEFNRLESSGGILLMICALVGLIWANGPWSQSYFALSAQELGFSAFGTGIRMPLIYWINDGLMALFFLVVGLEIKRELVAGELSSFQRAALPVAAALGGLVTPALIYWALNFGQPGVHGWGVPIATDIAFCLAVLSFLGKRVPIELKVFLTALAIVDDIGALCVIAAFYSTKLNVALLMYALLVTAGLLLLARVGVRNLVPYMLAGVVLWLLVLNSGIHATIAGVILAFCIPASAEDGNESPLEKAEHRLLPWSTHLAVPVFGLFNAGIAFGPSPFVALGDPIGLGVLAGLVIGKPIGILAASWAAVRVGLAQLPSSISWRLLAGAGCLAGIGFTMSIFIADLAFEQVAQVDTAKFAIMSASLISALIGTAVIVFGAKACPKN